MQQEVEKQSLFKCLRRNGLLAYRPDFDKGCLVPFEDEGGKLPMGSHRFPKAWLEERLSWRDEKGVPLEACWDEKCGAGVDSIEAMSDSTQHGNPKCAVKLACNPQPLKEVHLSMSGHVDVSVELPEEVPPSVELLESTKSRRKRTFDQHLSEQAPKPENKNKQVERQKIKSAYKILLPKWRAEQRAMGLSNKQLLSILIPSAGDRNKKQKTIEEGKKVLRDAQVTNSILQGMHSRHSVGLRGFIGFSTPRACYEKIGPARVNCVF